MPSHLPNGPSALIVAHPGHELFVSAWLRRSRPLVFIVTDGSGRSSTPRIETSRGIVESVGGQAGPVFGPLSDKLLYQAVLDGDIALFSQLVQEIAQALAERGIRQLVADAYERQYLSHDLCGLIAGASAALAEQSGGDPILRLAYPMFGYYGSCQPGPLPEPIQFQLDDEGLDWKTRAARSFPDPSLQKEVDELIAQRGLDGLRKEVLYPVGLESGFDDPERKPPRYERYGENLVSQGHYKQVIRYRKHVLPLVERLRQGSLTKLG